MKYSSTVKTFAEVRSDRPFDDFARRLRHQTAHAGELFHLLAIAPRAGIDHQEDRVQFLAALVVLEGAEHDVGNLVASVGPDVDDLVVALAIGDDAFAILLLDQLDLLVGVRELELFLLRNDHVGDTDRDAGLGRFREAEFLQPIERLDRALLAGHLIAAPDDVAELLLARGLVEEAESVGPDLVEDDAARGRFDDARFRVAVDRLLAEIRILQANPIVRFDRSIRHRELDFGRVIEERQARFGRGSRGAARILRKVITTERDVLRRRGDRLAARGREDVVRREHEHARFHLRLDRERHVHRHLVAVEVRVVSGADERMNADRFAFDQERLESLDRETMQSRRAVQQHRVTLGHFLEDVPDLRASGARSFSSRYARCGRSRDLSAGG